MAAWGMRHPVVYLPQFLLGMTFAVALQRGWRPRLHPAIPIGLLALYVYSYFHASLYLSKAAIARLENTRAPPSQCSPRRSSSPSSSARSTGIAA
ncbi:hypothetical protein [Streptomyces xanthochromogenes]|uniref:hypothetical protein n=1 Tax=Streptomyces xanthochromogenes TaxID=67384 RepID=UPI0034363B19